MHVDIKRADLARILTTALKVVEPKTTYPILANVLLSAEPGRVTVRGTDLDIEISASAAAECTAGVTTVAARALSDIVKKLGGDSVTLDLEGEHLIVKSGRSRFKLATLSPDSFPDLKAGNYGHSFTADLAALFAPVAFSISTEETRYYLNGIYLHAHGNVLRAVATDGHRMAQTETALPRGAAGLPGIIVPAKTVKVLSGHGGDVEVEAGSDKIRITSGDVIITSKLIEGTFPDYERVTPKNNDKTLKVKRSALSEAIARVGVIATERGGKAVKFSLAPQSLTLTVIDPNHGEASDELAVDYAAAPFEIGFNTRYALDVLANLKGDCVDFLLGEAGGPAIIRGDGAGQCVLMPMRV
jgi:DNA polymerase III subunit beta